MIVDIVRGEARVAPGIYRVLELSGFHGGIVEGIDSPIHKPERIRFDISQLA